MATKKREKKIERELNVEQKRGALIYADGVRFDFALMGLPEEVIYQLALTGAAEILARRKDPAISWERIKKGNFGKGEQPEPPLIVKALVRMSKQYGQEIALEDAEKQWKALGKEEKAQLRGDTKIQAIMRLLQAEKLSGVSEDSVAGPLFFGEKEELSESA